MTTRHDTYREATSSTPERVAALDRRCASLRSELARPAWQLGVCNPGATRRRMAERLAEHEVTLAELLRGEVGV
jgi:hypothetical protein